MENQENYLGLHNLVKPRNASKSKKRLGRGESSGLGKTSGRGHKGQKSRKSGHIRIGFEGGQNPLVQRLPKKGFTSKKIKNTVINLASLSDRFEDNASIDPRALVAAGLISNKKARIKILAVGEPKSGFKLQIHGISGAAREKIEKNGGTIEILA